jgi:hypothetical protein
MKETDVRDENIRTETLGTVDFYDWLDTFEHKLRPKVEKPIPNVIGK